MHKEILNREQIELLPLIRQFSGQFVLVGGTAIGLQIGHRQSIDFDLFSDKLIKPQSIKYKLKSQNIDFETIHQEYDQLHLVIKDVKITFFTFPFKISKQEKLDDIIGMPDLLSLGAMKAFALGGRGKWKDYVDLYFLLKYHMSLQEIETRALNMFNGAFSVKLFRQQLSFFNDVDYSEEVVFMNENPTKSEIESFLVNEATIEF